MKNFSILNSFIFLILINEIINNDAIDIYEDCSAGKYGLDCQKNCTCNKWSSSRNCSRIEGRCLDCKFGQFDVDCDEICDPRCKTNLCCAVLSSKYKKSKINIKTNITILNVKIGTKILKIAADYNVGYPLAIFNKSIPDGIDFENGFLETTSYNYSEYEVEGNRYENNSVLFINGKNELLNIVIPIIVDNTHDYPEINGVIGLCFYNSINMNLFLKGKIKLNIASFEVDNKMININFGSLFSKQKKYVHKLSYCKALSDEDSKHLRMKCKVEGMRAKQYSDALELDNTEIQFNLNKDSSFILKNESKYRNYITKYYFDDDNYYLNETSQSSTIFCFKKSKINRLSEFGFVINKYYYSYDADELFKESPDCSSTKAKYLKFRMELRNDDTNLIIVGKHFFNDMKFTIDNEEKKIYFYSDNVEYFSGDIVENFSSKPSLTSDPFATSLVGVAIVIFLNIITFLIYFYFKRKKEKIN